MTSMGSSWLNDATAARASPYILPPVGSERRESGTSGAAVLVEHLRDHLGARVVFGIPGVHNMAIFDALSRSGVRTVLVRHEQSAVYAADGYARATGRIGVAVTTTGPGAANAAAAMGEARAARSPVLHVSTQVDSRILDGRSGRFSLHESPSQRELMAAVSVWSAGVARPDAIASMVVKAGREAMSARRGPVFLEIPHDFLSVSVRAPAAPRGGARPIEADARSLTRAAALLADAKRPVLWVGGGAVSADATAAVRSVAEALGAPVVTTFNGKGILDRDHPLLVGYPPHQPEVTALVERADAVVVVGSDLDAMNTQGWRVRLPRPRIGINVVPEDARRNYACDVVVEADARSALEALLPLLEPRSGAAAERRVATVRERAEERLRSTREFAGPLRFVRRLEKLVPRDTVVFADMAVAGYWLAGYFRPSAPRRFASAGWGTLGFALPAAIGAAASGARALAVCGDAGALFAIGELATAVQEELPLAVLVVSDAGYGMLRFDARERYGAPVATDLRAPDFVALAESFGVPARRATQRDAAAALEWATAHRGPALVELRARFAPPLTTSPRWPLKARPEARP